MQQWLNEGLQHIWLPYTQMQFKPDPLLSVVGAEGCEIILEDGKRLIDGISSWWSMCHGYSHPYIVEKMIVQIKQLSHVMFAGCAHEPAYTLAMRIARLLPKDLTRVFFSDSGSTSVEVALKMAVQYYQNQGKEHKNKFISFSNSYHGDTAGCMSISFSSIHGDTFKHHLKHQYNIPLDIIELQKILEDKKNEIAAVVIEPILQGAGGMKLHSATTLKKIYNIAKQYDVLFIADEIATGFYRLGKRWGCDFAGITPDIITLGKALSGGMCSLGATIATEEIFNAFLSPKLEHAFMHGPTFMANPIACAAANASLDLFEKTNYIEKIRLIEQQLQEELAQCISCNKVKSLRVKGAMAALELQADWPIMFKLRREGVKLGIWIRPFADVMYLMPPFTISKNELSKLTTAINILCNKFLI